MIASTSSSHSSRTYFGPSPPQSTRSAHYTLQSNCSSSSSGSDQAPQYPRGQMAYSTSISPRRKAPPYSATIDETDVETNLYFPTFARRGSSPGQAQDQRRGSTATGRHIASTAEDVESEQEGGDRHGQSHTAKTDTDASEEDELDEIFELEQDEGVLHSHGLGYSFTPPIKVESTRRTSEQSNFSASTNDLNMVWDEEDADSDGAELDSLQSPPSSTTMASRRISVTKAPSRSPSSPSRSPTSPFWTSPVLQRGIDASKVPTIATLPFVRKVRRPSENVVSPSSYHWQASATTTALSRKNSTAGGAAAAALDISQRSRSFDRVKVLTASPNVAAGTVSVPGDINRSRSSTINVPSPSPQNTFASAIPNKLDVLRRKRSNTDPLASRWTNRIAQHPTPGNARGSGGQQEQFPAPLSPLSQTADSPRLASSSRRQSAPVIDLEQAP